MDFIHLILLALGTLLGWLFKGIRENAELKKLKQSTSLDRVNALDRVHQAEARCQSAVAKTTDAASELKQAIQDSAGDLRSPGVLAARNQLASAITNLLFNLRQASEMKLAGIEKTDEKKRHFDYYLLPELARISKWFSMMNHPKFGDEEPLVMSPQVFSGFTAMTQCLPGDLRMNMLRRLTDTVAQMRNTNEQTE